MVIEVRRKKRIVQHFTIKKLLLIFRLGNTILLRRMTLFIDYYRLVCSGSLFKRKTFDEPKYKSQS